MSLRVGVLPALTMVMIIIKRKMKKWEEKFMWVCSREDVNHGQTWA